MIAQTAHSSLSHVQFVSSQEKFEGLSRVFLYFLDCNVHYFGEVTTSITPCDITLVRRKDKQAQMMVAGVPARSISNICLKLKHQLTTGGTDITGCSETLHSCDPSTFSISRNAGL
jgi:hypothetical protein